MHTPPKVYISQNIGKNNKLPKSGFNNSGKAKYNAIAAS